MTAPILVGIDIGTTGLKAVALDSAGRLLREQAARYPTRLAGRAAEQDAPDWWRAACHALPTVVTDTPVLGVAITSQAPTLVAVDTTGQPCGPALTWADRRATREAREIAAIAEGRNGPDPYHGTAKLLWWRRHRHDLDTAHAVLAANGYMVRRLTGEYTLDDSTAALMQAWDDGFPPALADAGVPVGSLPDAVPCLTLVGKVTAEAAQHTGLPADTPVAAGGIDAVGAALEAGVLAPGDPTVEMTGFSTVTVQAAPRGTRIPGMIHSRHCLPDTDLLLSAQTSTGAVKDWLCRLTNRTPADCDDQLPADRPGRLLLVPSFAGERTPTWATTARGAVAGLDLDVTPGDLMLAVYEGTALALRECLDILGRHTPSSLTLRCVGGGARSVAWLHVKADVLGRPVEVPASGHGAAVGAGLLAGLAVGHFTTAGDLRSLTAGTRARYLPDPGHHAAYTTRLELFRQLRDSLPDLDDALVRPGEQEGCP